MAPQWIYHLSEPTVLQCRTLLNLMKFKEEEEEEVRGGRVE